MNYEAYLDLFEKIKNSNMNLEALTQLKNSAINNNLLELLEPKYTEVILYIFSRSIKSIINDLTNIFSDVNILDMDLVTFKKEINYIRQLINIDILSKETKDLLFNKIKQETDNTYDILLKEARRIDPTGIYEITIKNNRIKWSD